LHTESFQIECVKADGEAPGWLYKHRAELINSHEIQISGGKLVTNDGDRETHTANSRTFLFDTNAWHWRVA
jgi:hypothetical protein